MLRNKSSVRSDIIINLKTPLISESLNLPSKLPKKVSWHILSCAIIYKLRCSGFIWCPSTSNSPQQELCESVNHHLLLMCARVRSQAQRHTGHLSTIQACQSWTWGQLNWKYTFRCDMLCLCAHTVTIKLFSRCLVYIWYIIWVYPLFK